jgi:hypothetical protein
MTESRTNQKRRETIRTKKKDRKEPMGENAEKDQPRAKTTKTKTKKEDHFRKKTERYR